MRRVRAKFRCNSITLTQSSCIKPGVRFVNGGYVDADDNQLSAYQVYDTFDQPTVILNPIYAGSDASEEDKAFWDATPNGELKMAITNPNAAEVFELGRTYYLDFTPAD